METTDIIIVKEFCIHHEIEMDFINALHNAGLIETYISNDEVCMTPDQLPQLEKLVRLHELGINLEGIETITYLLQQLHDLQKQVHTLNCRLQLYETGAEDY